MSPQRLIPVLCLAILAGCGGAAAIPAAPAARPQAGGHPAVRAVRTAGASTRSPAALSAPAPGPGTREPGVPVAPPGSLAGTTVPGAPNCPMFPADNIWNTDISALPADPHSAAWLRSMDAASTYLHPDFGPDVGGYPYGIPFVIVTSAHPTVRISFQYSTESDHSPYPFGSGTPIEGGKNAGGDRHALMVNSSTCTLYELWDARYSARPAAGSGAIWNLRSDALRPANWTSADAAGLPILPGLLDYAQVVQAVRTGKPLTHAIRFTAQRTRSAYVWPARHEAGSGTSPSLPPMGARFRLKLSVSVAGYCQNSTPYCAEAKVILRAMQHYGLILADNGSNWYFSGSAFPAWPDGLVELLKHIPARDFEAVNVSCLMVSPDSGAVRARQGCPIG